MGETSTHEGSPWGTFFFQNEPPILGDLEAIKMAEREGFEPSIGFNTYDALAKRCFRPLSHLSGCEGR